MTLHIKRVVAAMTAVLTLLTLVPTAALPTIQFPALSEQSVETTVPTDDATAQLPDTSADAQTAPATDATESPSVTPDASADAQSAPATDATESPSATPDASADAQSAPATDATESPSATPDASADAQSAPATDVESPSETPDVSVDLPSAPVTNAADSTVSIVDVSTEAPAQPETTFGPVKPEDVLTSDAGAVIDGDNTLYIDSDNDGELEAVKGDVIEDDEDFNADGEFQQMLDSVTVGKDVQPSVEIEEDSVTSTEYMAEGEFTASGVELVDGYEKNAYEPTNTESEDHPFLPGGAAWIDLSQIKYGAPASPTYPFTKWSANTSFLNTSATAYDSQGRATAWVFPDVDLINETIWNTANYQSKASSSVSGTTGYAYNRYDAMQGKWGITVDKNVVYREFSANKYFNLSDTPYLAFSTEHEDGVKIAIALRIGTPTTWNTSGTATAWEYRWYTITDNNVRPGLDIDGNSVSMEPELQISSLGASAPIINDQSYVDGSITGCIDMTHWLPFVNPTTLGDASDKFRVNTVRIYKTGDAKAARVNYLYFLNQASNIFSPQTINADKALATTDATTITANTSTSIAESRSTATGSDDQNGWRNGAAFSSYIVHDGSRGGNVDVSTASKFTTTKASNGKTYVTTCIPVRKWINVAAQGRKVSFTVACSTTQKPVFVIYGNSKGFTDPDRTDMGISSSDAMLAVIGGNDPDGTKRPYLAHGSYYSEPGRIDFDFSKYLDYTAKSNWYDLLDSEYIRKHMVKSGTKAGWIYISEIQMIMEVGCKFNLGQINTSNNSDSLNAAHNDGAFDGGTGVQPNVDVSSGQTVTNKAAAFGPMLETSNFGTLDLLSRPSSKTGGNSSGFYGRVYKSSAEIKYGWNPIDVSKGTTTGSIAANTHFVVYATCTYSSKTYGMIGNPSGSVVWAPLANATAKTTNGKLYSAGTWTSSSTSGAILDAFANDNWIVSPFENGWGTDFIFKKSDAGYYYANLDGSHDTGEWSHNSYQTVISSYVRWGENDKYQESDTKIGLWSQTAMARALSTPFAIQKMSTSDGYTGTAPMLRYNFTTSNVGASDNSNNYLRIALALDIGGSVKHYYLKPSGTTVSLTTSASNFTANTTYSGYVSFDSIISANSGKTINLRGIAVYSRDSGTVRMRNMEVLYERPGDEYHWYDELNLSGSNVIDNVDIISDAFHYDIADGKKSLSSSGYNLVGNYGDKGWKIGSYKLDSSGSTSISNYVIQYPQYRPSLDHLRIPVAAGATGQFVFQSDRSFPTSNFKYLYVSYSVADDDGVAAADDNGATGIAMAIHQEQDATAGYYMDVSSSGVPSAMKYASTISTTKYSSCVNAAVDLSTISGLTSVNEIIFYFKNAMSQATDFYINYLFLSNVQPADFYKTEAQRPCYHNYYLMDGSGDRYSCRFPTTSNPTGRVTDSTYGNEASRVNPLIIERGDIFYEGTYYNGVPLNKLYVASDTLATSDDVEFRGGLSENDVLGAVWFYNYNKSKLGEEWGVSDFYQIDKNKISFTSTMTGTSVQVSYDALWHYNRWQEGWGLERYVGYDKATGNVEGTLLQLYATNNNVLLRTGLEPIRYQTVYDTQGGQMTYQGSADINTNNNGLIENENNYYITQTVVLSYYQWPIDMANTMKIVTPTRYGYTFAGWYDKPDGDESGTRIYRYNTKQEPGRNVLYAHWTKNSSVTRYKATFKKTSSSSSATWFTRTADATTYTITIPRITQITISGSKKVLQGWSVSGDTSGKIYTPGMVLTMTKAVTFLPVYGKTGDADPTVTITLTGNATLWADRGDASMLQITNGYKGIKLTTSGTTRTYTNIPRYMVVEARPASTSTSKAWIIQDSSDQAYFVTTSNYTGVTNGLATKTRATGQANYRFSANTDVTLSYEADSSNDYRVWTMPKPFVTGDDTSRQMMFYSQYNIYSTSTYEFVSCGTLYTKDSQLASLGLTTSSSAADFASKLGTAMQFTDKQSTTPPTYATTSSAVRYVEATTTNDNGQYYLMVTENKGKAVTYYARGYLVFKHKTNGTYYYRYSSTITKASVAAVS